MRFRQEKRSMSENKDKINNTKILYERLMKIRASATEAMLEYLNKEYPFQEEFDGQFNEMVEEIMRNPELIKQLWEG